MNDDSSSEEMDPLPSIDDDPERLQAEKAKNDKELDELLENPETMTQIPSGEVYWDVTIGELKFFLGCNVKIEILLVGEKTALIKIYVYLENICDHYKEQILERFSEFINEQSMTPNSFVLLTFRNMTYKEVTMQEPIIHKTKRLLISPNSCAGFLQENSWGQFPSEMELFQQWKDGDFKIGSFFTADQDEQEFLCEWNIHVYEVREPSHQEDDCI